MLHLSPTVFCILLPPTSVLWPLVVDGSHLSSWLPLTQSVFLVSLLPSGIVPIPFFVSVSCLLLDCSLNLFRSGLRIFGYNFHQHWNMVPFCSSLRLQLPFLLLLDVPFLLSLVTLHTLRSWMGVLFGKLMSSMVCCSSLLKSFQSLCL